MYVSPSSRSYTCVMMLTAMIHELGGSHNGRRTAGRQDTRARGGCPAEKAGCPLVAPGDQRAGVRDRIRACTRAQHRGGLSGEELYCKRSGDRRGSGFVSTQGFARGHSWFENWRGQGEPWSSRSLVIRLHPSGLSWPISTRLFPPGRSWPVSVRLCPSGRSQPISIRLRLSGSSQPISIRLRLSGSSQPISIRLCPPGWSQPVNCSVPAESRQTQHLKGCSRQKLFNPS